MANECSKPEGNRADTQLVDISTDTETPLDPEPTSAQITVLNNKIEKMEQLMTKYKESLKSIKEKNSQLTTELQVVSNELDHKTKAIEHLNSITPQLMEAQQQIQELKDINEELQNKINTYDFTRTKEISTLEMDYKKAQEEITQLKSKIHKFSKREEEYAISLAENKLSIHKELESKETEIKTLKDNLSECKKEIQSFGIVVNDYKNNISSLEEEREKLKGEVAELKQIKQCLVEKDIELKDLRQKYQTLEQSKIKSDEAYKCLELQAKQETAEKMAIIDRNAYLENRNKQINDENTKKTVQLSKLEGELEELRVNKKSSEDTIVEKNKTSEEISLWKDRYKILESEIQEEREELVKLQSEIEKLLANHVLIQNENVSLKELVTQLQSENRHKQEFDSLKEFYLTNLNNLKKKTTNLKIIFAELANEVTTLRNVNTETSTFSNNIISLLKLLHHENEINDIQIKYDNLMTKLNKQQEENNNIKQQYESSLVNVEKLIEEKKKLGDKIICIETEKERCFAEHQQQKTDQHTKLLAEMEILGNENLTMALKIDETEKKCSDLKSELQHANQKHELKVKQLQADIKELLTKTKEQETKYTATINELNEIKMEKHALYTEVQNSEHNKTDTEKLKRNVDELEHENNTLKKNFESIASNFKTLEYELADVRRSHSEIESEKDRLSSIIEIFEQNELKKSARNSRESQTIEDYDSLQTQIKSALEEINILKTKCELVKQEKEDLYEQIMTLEQKSSENERMVEEKQKEIDVFTSQIETLQSKYEQQNIELEKLIEANVNLSSELTGKTSLTANIDSLQKSEALETECDLLKDENRRLKSDIEGLQTYLTKISKENSTLNDKIRELIASSDGNESHDTSALTKDIERLKNEIEIEKEKSIDLVRQNTLLEEENFELKDQLQCQNYVRPVEMKAIELNANDLNNSGLELASLKDKFDNIVKSKKEMEDKLLEAGHLNQSVNNNVKQLQDSNHKLRTTNEKLERRLDEALVSLRHLHSLQENTELEYLRNVLYEYLTGSGTHSETLAKVLAAVVKFDDKQTQQVLQKERERQGLVSSFHDVYSPK